MNIEDFKKSVLSQKNTITLDGKITGGADGSCEYWTLTYLNGGDTVQMDHHGDWTDDGEPGCDSVCSNPGG